MNYPITINGDALIEANETFTMNLSAPTNATIGAAQGIVTILNDDSGFVQSLELAGGSELVADLRPVGGQPAVHLYRIGQQPRSSYEVVIDGTSGDVGAALGLDLRRYAADQTTQLQGSEPISTGSSRSLRWTNLENFAVNHQFIKVRSTQCGTDCGADDVYRIRVFDTTYAVPRFNNGGQTTLLFVRNAAPYTIQATVDFWSDSGTLLHSHGFTAHANTLTVVNTATVVPGLSGSMTVSNNGGYADLVGKAVSIEPSTGFTFDTQMTPRPR